MKKHSITLAVFNEEKFIGRCLASIKDIASEIIVVDGKSTDETVKIAKKFGAKIVETTNKTNFHINKKMANDSASGEWILQLDADEVVTPELGKEIKETINRNPEENGFWLPRANYFLGRFLRKGGTYPDYTLRLYRRGFGNLPAKSVHEQAEVVGKTGYLKNDLLHYADRTFERYMMRFNRYTDIEAREVQGGLLKYLIWLPLFDRNQGFLSIYFRHLGFLDGFPGFIWALYSSLHFPIAYFKSLDIKKGRA